MKSFLNPGSVVLIGVTRHGGVGAYNNLEVMLNFGVASDIYVVHPHVKNILGYPAYTNIMDVPIIPELAIISVGRNNIISIFNACAEKGIKRVIIVSQGFSDADEKGAHIQDELVKIAKENSIRIMGPNTLGVLNNFDGFTTSFVTIPKEPSPVPLGAIVQSGVFLADGQSFTNGLGKAIDIGNGSDIDFVDGLNYFETDPDIEIIAIYMEEIKRGRVFLKTASRISRKKPIIVLKSGRSEAGGKAALSHTGSLVGEDAVYDIALEKAGLVRAKNMIELKSISNLFLHCSPMKGQRLAVVTATGAAGILAADACDDYGLHLASIKDDTLKNLEVSAVKWFNLNNPADIWPLGMVTGNVSNIVVKVSVSLIENDQVDGLLIVFPAFASSLHDDINFQSIINRILKKTRQEKPIAVWLYGKGAEQQKKSMLRQKGFAFFENIDEAVMGLAGSWRYFRNQQQKKDFEDVEPSKKINPSVIPSNGIYLGKDAFELMRRYNLPVVSGKIINSRDQAMNTADRIGYPVVLKVISRHWLHKSDEGGVVVGIRNPRGLKDAYNNLVALFHKKFPEKRLPELLLQRQVVGKELIFGIKREPRMGHVILAGMGGIYTEIFNDTARELAPVTKKEAEKMLRSLKYYPVLKGIRGEASVDIQSLIDIITSLSELAMDYPEISEVDLNPVIINQEGCWCVDSRIIF